MKLSELSQAVPYKGRAAGFGMRAALLQIDKTQFFKSTPHALHRYLYLKWQSQLLAGGKAFHSVYSHLRYTQALNCHSAFVFVPDRKLITCRLSWLCPFCYIRRVLDLRSFIIQRKYHIDYEVMSFDVRNDLNIVWRDIDNITRSYSRHRDGLLVWRQIFPTKDGTAIRLFQMWPSVKAYNKTRLYRQLSHDLCYPIEWLLCEPERMVSLMGVIKERKCFATHGCYRKGNV